MRLSLGLASLAVAMTLSLGSGGVAWSMESNRSVDAAPSDPDYGNAVKAVKDGRYADAVPLLAKTVTRDPKNADAWNYLGFSQRKLGKYPDALAAYEKALALDPEHLGANEYLGELYLDMGDMPKAEERLARLDHLCMFGCAEYRTLKAAIKAKKTGT